MTNLELLRKLLSDRPISIQFLCDLEIFSLIKKLEKVFNIKQNYNSSIVVVKMTRLSEIYKNYDYIYFKSKGRNSRVIRKGKFDMASKYESTNYREVRILIEYLLDEKTDLNELIKTLKNES